MGEQRSVCKPFMFSVLRTSRGLTCLSLLVQWVAAGPHRASTEPPLRPENDEISQERTAQAHDLSGITARFVLLNRTF